MIVDAPAPASGSSGETGGTGTPVPPRTEPRRAGSDTPWRTHLRTAERAVDRGDVRGALQAWEEAHVAAIESSTWEGLLETGRTGLRTGLLRRGARIDESAARRAFFAALYRACRANSFEGVVRSADAFSALGDREVVDECLGLAQLLAEGDEPRRRLAELVKHLGGPGGSDPGGVTS